MYGIHLFRELWNNQGSTGVVMDGTRKLRVCFRRVVVVAFAFSAMTPDALDLTLVLRAESLRQAPPASSCEVGSCADVATHLEGVWEDRHEHRESDHGSSDVFPLVWPELGLATPASRASQMREAASSPDSEPIAIGQGDARPSLSPAPEFSRPPSLCHILCRLDC
jgi:hypothetical protein